MRAAGWPSTRRPHYLQVNHILLADGTELLVGRIREPRWSETHLGSGEWAVDPATAASATASGLFRVWSQRLGGAFYFLGADAYRLTDSALAAVSDWNEFEDDPVLDCTAPGMPAMMSNPYPMEFIERADGDIVVRFEEFDSIRTIHITDVEDPADMPASPMGYSTRALGRGNARGLDIPNQLALPQSRRRSPERSRRGSRALYACRRRKSSGLPADRHRSFGDHRAVRLGGLLGLAPRRGGAVLRLHGGTLTTVSYSGLSFAVEWLAVGYRIIGLRRLCALTCPGTLVSGTDLRSSRDSISLGSKVDEVANEHRVPHNDWQRSQLSGG